MRIILKLAASFILCCTYSFAAEPNYCAESSPDGVTLEADERRVVSVTRVPVKFLDSSGFRKARVIGQERAKGELIRWLDQTQTTTRIVDAENSDSESATQTTDSQGVLQSKTYTREEADVVREVEMSVASGELIGMRQVEEHFDSSAQELCVAMGYSVKSAQSTIDAREWMKGDAATQTDNQIDREVGTNATPANDKSSYTRRAPEDW